LLEFLKKFKRDDYKKLFKNIYGDSAYSKDTNSNIALPKLKYLDKTMLIRPISPERLDCRRIENIKITKRNKLEKLNAILSNIHIMIGDKALD
jgi:hypothetical protein